MDKAKLRSGLSDLIRQFLPKQLGGPARVTCLLSVRLDGSDEAAVFVDITEDLPATRTPTPAPANAASAPATAAAASTAVAAKATESKSKRKSQAPQKMVANGEDSFVPATCSPPPSATSNGEASASSSFLNISGCLEQAVNLTNGSRNGGLSPVQQQQQQPRQASTPLKDVGMSAATGNVSLGFYVNNPGFQHFLLPQGAAGLFAAAAAASVFPQPTAVFQPALVSTAAISQQPPPPPPTAKTPPPTGAGADKQTAAAASSAAGAEEDQSPTEALSKLPILPSIQTAQQPRPRSLFGLRSRRGGHKSFPCNQCHETFGSLATLSKHTYSMHKSYKCTFCSANFTQRSNLQRHSLKHVGFKPFACRCCQKSYYRKDHLVRHIEVTHPGKEPKKNIETKLSSAECLEFLERRYESGEYSITLDADADEEMPDGEGDADAQRAVQEGDEEMPEAEADEEEEEAEEEEDDETAEAAAAAAAAAAATASAAEEEAAKAADENPEQQPQQHQQHRRRRPLRRQETSASVEQAGIQLQIELPAKWTA